MDDKLGEITSEYEDKIDELQEKIKDLEFSLKESKDKAESNFLFKRGSF